MMKEFAEKIMEKLQEKLVGKEMEVKTIQKNGGSRTGIIIREPGINVAPTIYIDGFYNRYVDGTIDMDHVISEIVGIYERNKADADFNVAELFTKEKVLANVVPALYQANQEFLTGLYTTDFLDLAVVYKYVINENAGGMASISLTPQQLSTLDITEKELKEVAYKNLCAQGKTQDIVDVLEMGGIPLMPRNEMIVISNMNGYNGAGQMMNRKLMNSVLATLETDSVYVIPSSIHECICVRCDVSEDVLFLKDMIVSVNATEVAPEEKLSDSLYMYTKADGIQIVKGEEDENN